MPIRSFLYVPGNNLKMMHNALKTEADAVIFDLEDSVLVGEKEKARDQVSKLIASSNQAKGKGPKIYVQINRLDNPESAADIHKIINSNLSGIFLPKAENPEEIQWIDRLITDVEVDCRIPKGEVDLIPKIESAEGLYNAKAIAGACKRVSRLALGAINYALDMGICITNTGEELIFPRTQLVLACRLENKRPPVDCVCTEITNLDMIYNDTQRGKNLGMAGKMVIHPNQIEIVNKIYSPGEEEIEAARRVVSAYKEASMRGIGVIQVDGKMVDHSIVQKAKRTIEAASSYILKDVQRGKVQ